MICFLHWLCDVSRERHILDAGQRLGRIYRRYIRIRIEQFLQLTGRNRGFIAEIDSWDLVQQIIDINAHTGGKNQDQRKQHTENREHDPLPPAGLFFLFIHFGTYFLVIGLGHAEFISKC